MSLDASHADFPALVHPIVQAPLAGGPSTPELAAAVSNAGGLGFLAAGYKTTQAVRDDIASTRARTSGVFGINLFVLGERAVDRGRMARYARRMELEAERYGVPLGEPRFEDDWLGEKVELILDERLPIVSTTFDCPPRALIDRLHDRGISVWVTVTEVEEAVVAQGAGADALIVQGVEAGGHRGSFEDRDGRGELGVLPLVRLVGRAVRLPLVAAGGIADGAGVAAALAAGARAAQIGTAFLRCPEAGTSAVHRAALTRPAGTALTRAFTGKRARGIVNRFLTEHSSEAPEAYPHVHHLTAPLRAAARAAGDAEAINLWAGQAYLLAEEEPAGELVRRWGAEARTALADAHRRLTSNQAAALPPAPPSA